MQAVMGQNTGIPNPMNQLGAIPGMYGAGADILHITRQARRLYIGNVPVGSNQEDLKAFLNATITEAQGNDRKPGDAILSVYINQQRRFAFLEFRSMEEASSSMALDGIIYRGEALKVGRPANYNPVLLPHEQQESIRYAQKLDVSKLGIVSSQVLDGPAKIFAGGLPYELDDEQVKELLTTYGPLKSFHLVKDMQTAVSKGFCFYEYIDPSVTQEAIDGLNGIQIGDRTLTVRKHCPPSIRGQ